MKLGETVTSGPRYDFLQGRGLRLVGRCLVPRRYSCASRPRQAFADGWHVRTSCIVAGVGSQRSPTPSSTPISPSPIRPVVAVTLARLKLSQTMRFTRWGKPVERQVRDHDGKTLALAAMRPPNTFCTFSIWKSEAEMINMVSWSRRATRTAKAIASPCRSAFVKDFHREFTTMRFVPVGELGEWDGGSNSHTGRLRPQQARHGLRFYSAPMRSSTPGFVLSERLKEMRSKQASRRRSCDERRDRYHRSNARSPRCLQVQAEPRRRQGTACARAGWSLQAKPAALHDDRPFKLSIEAVNEGLERALDELHQGAITIVPAARAQARVLPEATARSREASKEIRRVRRQPIDHTVDCLAIRN